MIQIQLKILIINYKLDKNEACKNKKNKIQLKFLIIHYANKQK